MQPLNLTGKKFGRLKVVKFSRSRKLSAGISYRYWNCLCDCGAELEVSTGNLNHAHTQSCGCLQRDRALEANRIHLGIKTAEFACWVHIRQRCENERSKDYRNYGARGIKVCVRWNSFLNFLSDMGKKPSHHLTIERIDNDGDYSPSNCRWATRKEQNRNSRSNRLLSFGGNKMTTSQWAEFMGVPRSILHKRAYRGWSDEKVLTTPVRGHANANHP